MPFATSRLGACRGQRLRFSFSRPLIIHFTGEAYQGFDYGKSKKLCTASIKGGAVGLKS